MSCREHNSESDPGRGRLRAPLFCANRRLSDFATESPQALKQGMHTRHTESLYRQKAIDSLAMRLDGRPISVMPRPWWWLTAFCAAFVLAVCYFLWSAEYARKETVRGWLVAEPGVVSLSHSNFATVAGLEREAGDRVRRGDPIVLLSSAVQIDNGVDSTQEVLDQLDEQLSGAARREELTREQFVADHRALEEQISGIDGEIRALGSQQDEQNGRVRRSVARQMGLRTAFERGAIARLDLLRQEDELATTQQSVARLRQEQNTLRRERQGLLATRQRLGIELEHRLAELGSERSELRQRIAQHEKQRIVVLPSPIDGTVATLDVIAGNTIRPQQRLATILPEHSTLTANVYVPSHAIGMIRPGQSVRLLYDAFPHHQFGAGLGDVDAVAGFVSLPGDMPAAIGLREAAYKVTIGVASDHVEDEEGRYALRPGMALAAEIILDTRSLANWFLAPLKARF